MIQLSTPISEEAAASLQVGDTVEISGYILCGRDAVLPKVLKMIEDGTVAELGVDLHGQVIFHKDGDKDTGRCCADNIWAGNPGAEFWGSRPANTVMNGRGDAIGNKQPAQNFLIYWDGDLERELLDGTWITKMTGQNQISTIFTADGCGSGLSRAPLLHMCAALRRAEPLPALFCCIVCIWRSA